MRYARFVPLKEIVGNDYNLNIPRYIDSQETEDLQDIEGHLCGGISERDIDALGDYWAVCPELRQTLFKPNRPGYADLAIPKDTIEATIFGRPGFTRYIDHMNGVFARWQTIHTPQLTALQPGFHLKQMIQTLAEELLDHYADELQTEAAHPQPRSDRDQSKGL